MFQHPSAKMILWSVASLSGLGFLIAVMLFQIKPGWVNKSQNRMIALWQQQADFTENPLVFFAESVDFSAQFYARSHTFASTQLTEICQRLDTTKSVYFVVDKQRLTDFQNQLHLKFKRVGHEIIMSRVEYLLKVESLGC